MSTREQFEATMRKLSVKKGTALWVDCEIAWQAAEAAAIERCAKMADASGEWLLARGMRTLLKGEGARS